MTATSPTIHTSPIQHQVTNPTTDVRRTRVFAIYVYCIFFMRTVVTVVMLLVFHDMVVDRLSVLIDKLVVFFRLWPVWLGRMMDDI